MSNELEKKIKDLEEQVSVLAEKLNEIIVCLEDNELTRKVSVEYLETGEEEAEGEETPSQETPSQ